MQISIIYCHQKRTIHIEEKIPVKLFLENMYYLFWDAPHVATIGSGFCSNLDFRFSILPFFLHILNVVITVYVAHITEIM